MNIPEKKSYPILAKLIFWAQKKKYGQALNSSKIWARRPVLMYGLQVFYRALDRKNSAIESELRILLNLKVSQLNGCAFCLDISTALLLQKNISLEKVNALKEFRSHPLLNPREQLCLSYAEAMTLNQSTRLIIDDLRKYFCDDDIVELTALIGYQNLSSKFNAALDIPAQGFCTTSAIHLEK